MTVLEYWEMLKLNKEEKQILEKRLKDSEPKFVVHGILKYDEKSDEYQLMNFSDLDGKCALGFLKLAGINIKNLEYVKPGESVPGKINIDTGVEDGVEIKEDGTIFFDHHGEYSHSDNSATKVTYEVLVSLGFLKQEDYLDKMVEFVTQVDTHTFPEMFKYFKTSDRTILGLRRFLRFEPLLKFFQDGKKPTDVLTDEELKRYGMIYKDNRGFVVNRSEQQKKVIDQAEEQIRKLEEDGFVIESVLGKMIIDIGNQLWAGQEAVRAYGYDAYLIWSPKTDSFFIASGIKDIDFELPQGLCIRKRMWIKQRGSGSLSLTLAEVLKVLTGKTGSFSPALNKVIEEDSLRIKN